MKGKLIKWNPDKAFGFIALNGGGDHVFIHKTALSNRNRIPKVNDVITFSIAKDKSGRYWQVMPLFRVKSLRRKK